jgi:hypothetical protein
VRGTFESHLEHQRWEAIRPARDLLDNSIESDIDLRNARVRRRRGPSQEKQRGGKNDRFDNIPLDLYGG